MATEVTPPADTASTTPEGTDTDPKGQQQQQAAPETGDQSKQQAATVDKDTKLPDDHPLIVNHAKLKGDLATAKTELAEARAQAAKVTKLEDELAARPSKESVDTLQTRYDRLEGFLQAAGGPLGKALDSRTFTKELFESDKPIADIVKDWNKANPTTTSTALESAAAEPGKGKVDPNVLLRAAAGH
jgi:hypothetical protein